MLRRHHSGDRRVDRTPVADYRRQYSVRIVRHVECGTSSRYTSVGFVRKLPSVDVEIACTSQCQTSTSRINRIRMPQTSTCRAKTARQLARPLRILYSNDNSESSKNAATDISSALSTHLRNTVLALNFRSVRLTPHCRLHATQILMRAIHRSCIRAPSANNAVRRSRKQHRCQHLQAIASHFFHSSIIFRKSLNR